MLHGHALWPCRKFTIRFIQSFGEACMEGPSVRGTQQIGRLYGFSLHRRSTFFVTFLPHDHVQLRSSRSLGLLSEHSNSQTKLSVREFDSMVRKYSALVLDGGTVPLAAGFVRCRAS